MQKTIFTAKQIYLLLGFLENNKTPLLIIKYCRQHSVWELKFTMSIAHLRPYDLVPIVAVCEWKPVDVFRNLKKNDRIKFVAEIGKLYLKAMILGDKAGQLLPNKKYRFPEPKLRQEMKNCMYRAYLSLLLISDEYSRNRIFENAAYFFDASKSYCEKRLGGKIEMNDPADFPDYVHEIRCAQYWNKIEIEAERVSKSPLWMIGGDEKREEAERQKELSRLNILQPTV